MSWRVDENLGQGRAVQQMMGDDGNSTNPMMDLTPASLKTQSFQGFHMPPLPVRFFPLRLRVFA